MKKAKKARLGRPPKGAENVLRLQKNGKWVPDDGKPGVAFSGQMKIPGAMCRDMLFPFAWTDFDDNRDWEEYEREALSHTSGRFGCANGEQFVVERKKAVKK
jgi:hypothetical protein